MTIALTCPTCGKKISVPDKAAGKRGKCPQCHELIAVPSVTAVPAAKPRKPPPDERDEQQGAEQAKKRSKDRENNGCDEENEAAREETKDRRQNKFNKKKSNKNLLLAVAIGGGGFLVLAACVLAAVIVTWTVVKKDREKNPDVVARRTTSPVDVVKPAGVEGGRDTAKTPGGMPTQKQPSPQPPIPHPEQPQKPPEPPYELKGDRLGMSLKDFRTKYHRTFNAGKEYVIPFCSDQRSAADREKAPLATLFEQTWHPKANITNARVTYPFEDYEDNEHTPKLAGIKTDMHYYGFIDGEL
jgi:hypothetical protein